MTVDADDSKLSYPPLGYGDLRRAAGHKTYDLVQRMLDMVQYYPQKSFVRQCEAYKRGERGMGLSDGMCVFLGELHTAAEAHVKYYESLRIGRIVE